MSEYTGLIGLPTTGQSPINLDDRLVRTRKYSPLVLNGHWLNDGEARLFNSGSTAKVFLTGDRIPSTVCGGPLADDVYELTEVHFHWGKDDCRGAEHTINDTWYSMEGHAIHWNRKYLSPEECFRHKDGYCILAYLFLVQPGCCDCINPQLERITDNLKDIADANMETKAPPNCLSWMRWATYCDRYYTYAGSYNSGEYPECVTWIVFPVVIPIRSSQRIDQFYLLFASSIYLAEVQETIARNVELIRKLVDTDGQLESPIDLDISYMKLIELGPLQWFSVDVKPRKLKMTNTGYTVILSMKWQEENHYITGGPFLANYEFSQIHFHWGENEIYGSEHTVDGSCMPMELHAVYFRTEYETLESALRRPDGVTILVYFLKLQGEPNQFLEEITKNLAVIRTAHSSVRLVPVVLSNILRPFTQDYFLYWGSVITIRNLHSILWIISREPIGISVEQVAEFRTLNDEREAPILSNVRSLKGNQERNIFHVCPSGATYASLLPIPRDLSADQTDDSSKVENIVDTV